MEVLCLIIGLFGVCFGVYGWKKLQKERRRMEELSRQTEHFLLYADDPLPEVLNEGALANLNNQLSRLEQLLLHHQEQSRRREEQTTRFVENMAHQMKNALTALQIQLDLLSLHISPEVQSSLEKSQACMERLTNEIERVLKSSQLAAGKINMEFEVFDLPRELALCVERLAPLADSKGVSCHITGPEQLTLSADSFWLSEALENLMKNAIEHTAENTRVTVRISDHGRKAAVRVEDSGSGILPSELSELFTRFHRGSVSKAGYGIGLSMAKDIIEAHHGALTAGNRPEGGAWFEAVLPQICGAKTYEI